MDVVPHDCVILVGVALSEADFVRQASVQGTHAARVHRGYGGDAAAAFRERWQQTSDRMRERLESIRAIGASIVERVDSLDMVRDAFRVHAVVILTSHWTGDAIQLQHKAITVDDLIAAIEPERVGALDIGVCESADRVLPRLVSARPSMRAAAIRGIGSLPFHLSIVRATLRTLATHPRPYEVAVAEVAAEFLVRYAEEFGREE